MDNHKLMQTLYNYPCVSNPVGSQVGKGDPDRIREEERQRIINNNISKVAYIIGNGVSRKNFDLNKLIGNGTSLGCNALYRDFEPDYLIAIDHKMITEIVDYARNHGTPQNKKEYLDKHFWVRHLPEGIEWHRILPPSRGWASGPTAALLAIETLLYDRVYLIGFDFEGLPGKTEEKTFNNMYADTSCYQSVLSKETFYKNWVQQIDVLLAEFPDVNMYRVQSESFFIPEQLELRSNLRHITYQDFEDFLENSSK